MKLDHDAMSGLRGYVSQLPLWKMSCAIGLDVTS